MIPTFDITKIHKNLSVVNLDQIRLTSDSLRVVKNTQSKEPEGLDVGDDFTILIPVSMPPFQSKEQRLSRQLERDFEFGASKIQGVRKDKKTIKSQLDTLHSTFTPGLPMLPIGLMHKWGFVAGVKNNPRTRVVPLGIPEDWNMIVSEVSYLITGFASIHHSSNRFEANRKVTLLDNNQLMLLKVNPIGLNQKQVVSDLFQMIAMSPSTKYFPLGIILVEKNVNNYPNVVHFPAEDEGSRLFYMQKTDAGREVAFLNPKDLPDQPQANNINFSNFARDWNKE